MGALPLAAACLPLLVIFSPEILYTVIYSITGALDIDEQFHVLKADGQPLKGLYVVGTGTDRLGVLFIKKKSM